MPAQTSITACPVPCANGHTTMPAAQVVAKDQSSARFMLRSRGERAASLSSAMVRRACKRSVRNMKIRNTIRPATPISAAICTYALCGVGR